MWTSQKPVHKENQPLFHLFVYYVYFKIKPYQKKGDREILVRIVPCRTVPTDILTPMYI